MVMSPQLPTQADTVFEVIRTRRVTRNFTGEPVSEQDLRRVLEAARWAISAGNRRIHKFIVVRNSATIQLIRAVSPGMLALPAALIVICTDMDKAAREQVQLDRDSTTWIDVGAAAMNMIIMAHALGLGTCPTTSFSRSGVSTVLELPPSVVPEFILQLGHPAPQVRVMRPGVSTRLRVEDFTFWERYGRTTP